MCMVKQSGKRLEETPSFPVLPGTFLSSGVLNKRKGGNFPKLPIHSKEGAASFPAG